MSRAMAVYIGYPIRIMKGDNKEHSSQTILLRIRKRQTSYKGFETSEKHGIRFKEMHNSRMLFYENTAISLSASDRVRD